jgi:signal transduction histidine kinase/ligand-binding sensor domain-containing protein/DNA-binding response OmpR family regulator
MRQTIATILFVLITIPSFSQEIQFDLIDIEDGLSDNSVRDILQDKNGYMWFATLNGLSRYDGKNFKNYYSIPGDPSSLSNSRMVTIKEDKRGNIWCRTDDANIYRVNPKNNNVLNLHKQIIGKEVYIRDFIITTSGDLWLWGNKGCIQIKYTDSSDKIEATIFDKENYFPSNKINFVNEDLNGNIWIGTESGLVRYQVSQDGGKIINTHFDNVNIISSYVSDSEIWFGSEKKGIRKYDLQKKSFDVFEDINASFSNKPIYCLRRISRDILLLGSQNAIFELNTQSRKHLIIANENLELVTGFFTDSKKNTWVIPSNRGVFRYDIALKKLKYFNLNSEKREFLGDNDKQEFFEDSKQNLWVGIHGGGLFRYIPSNDGFENFSYSEENSKSLSSDLILSICEDNSNNLWVGTMYGGLNKIDLTDNNFVWYQPIPNPANLFENEIRSAVTDKKGNIWMGSKGGYIYCYDADYNLKYTLPDDLSAPNKSLLKNINVYSMFIDSDENLWIGTKGKGVFIFRDIINNSIKNLRFKHILPSQVRSLDKVYSIAQDSHNQYWIGSLESGLTVLRNPFEQLEWDNLTNNDSEDQIISNSVRYLFLDDSENLWVGTSDGISLLTSNQLLTPNKKFISSANNKYDLTSLSYNSVDYISQTSDKKIYVATMGGGINKLEKYSTANNTFEWEYFNTSHGITTNKIFAIQEDSDKNLWFSTSLGLNKFNPQTGSFEKFLIERAQGLNYFCESCATKTRNGELIFGHRRGFVAFNPNDIKKDSTIYPIVLSSLFVNGNEILPKESDLLEKSIEFEKEVSLSHLQNSIRLNFSVLDFSNPEKIQYSYLLDGFENNWSPFVTNNSAIYQNLPSGKYTFRLKATNSDGVELPSELKFKINIKPPFWRSLYGYGILIFIAASLIIVFLILYKRQISAKHKMEYGDKLNEKKLKYYTNISHEFKTPLTLILGPAQDIVDDNDASQEVITSAKQIKKNAGYLLNLIEQILDFRKIREEKMTLSVEYTNISTFVKNIYDEFKPLATKKNINFANNSSQQINGYIDSKVLTKIIYNLLSNAFKFTPSNKSVTVSTDLDAKARVLKLSVQDEGKGINKKDQSMLFERFQRSENSSGIGLFYVKELVSTHKGDIKLTSEQGKGTIFAISIPISKENYNRDEFADDILNENATVYTTQIDEGEIEIAESRKSEFENSILIIEDNHEMREYLAKKFKNNYSVLTAENGKIGLDIAVNQSPDMIICDVMMPVMDGIETVKNLRKNFNTSHIPVILLTANSSEEKKLEGIETGADDYITKPFNFKLLKLKIDNLVNQRKKIIQSFNTDPDLPANILTKSDMDKDFIEKVKQLIEENLGEPDFTVNTLSSKVGYSRTNFYKKMKGITGETPNGFISTIQMKRAAVLLKETDYAITDVSVLVGFNDKNYFSKLFKKHFGITPKAYQIENRS